MLHAKGFDESFARNQSLLVSGNSIEIKRRNSGGHQEVLKPSGDASKSVMRRVYTPIHIKINENYVEEMPVAQHSFLQRPCLKRKFQLSSVKSGHSIREAMKMSSVTFPRCVPKKAQN
jgi:hypothetical protein